MVNLHPKQVLLQRGNLKRSTAGAAAFVGVLDGFGNPAGAWSVYRKLLSSFSGSAVRVRRGGDNAEFDFGFDKNGFLDGASITAFCVAGGGSKDGYVVKLYDQSGNGNDLIQASAGAQSRIAVNGMLLVDGSNIPLIAPTASGQSVYASPVGSDYTGSEFWTYLNLHNQNTADQAFGLSMAKGSASVYSTGSMSPVLSFLDILAGQRDGNFSSTTLGISTGRKLYSGSFNSNGWDAEDPDASISDHDTPMQGNFDVNRFVLFGVGSGNPASHASFYFVEAVAYLENKSSSHAAIRTALTLV